MSSFFVGLKIILGIIGALIVAVILVALLVYFVWMILNPSEAKRVVKKIFTWLDELFSFLKPSKGKKRGISLWLVLGILLGLTSLFVGIYFLFFENFNFNQDFDRPWWHWLILGLIIFIILLIILLNYSKKTSTSTSNLSAGGKIKSFLKSITLLLKSWKFPKWIKQLFWFALVFLAVWYCIGYIGAVFAKEHYYDNIGVKKTEYQQESIAKYQQLKIGKANVFSANEWQRFRFKPSNTKEQKYLNFYTQENSTKVVILNFKRVSDGYSWSWKLWRETENQPLKSELLGTLPQAFTGDCLVRADQDCKLIVLLE